MIRVAALTSGKVVPSSRFRVRQHIEPLRALGLAVREHIPAIGKYAPVPGWPSGVSARLAPQLYPWQGAKLASRIPGLVGSWRSDATWLERGLLPGRLTLEPLLRDPVVFDVDDAIWLSSPSADAAAKAMAKRAAVVIAGNEYLADWLSSVAADVRVVPTAVDTERFSPSSDGVPDDDEHFVIGWIGSAATLQYLEAIDQPLGAFFRRHRRAELRVVADREPVFRSVPRECVRFVPWSHSREVSAIRGMHVGLMPLPDTEWSRGKCSFKMLQYMACGVPVVVSPVGMNREVLASGNVGFAAAEASEWLDVLARLYQNREEGFAMGLAGRTVVEDRYSLCKVTATLANIFSEVCGRPKQTGKIDSFAKSTR